MVMPIVPDLMTEMYSVDAANAVNAVGAALAANHRA
jgi:hypothetical protein